MAKAIRISHTLWEELITIIDSRLTRGSLDKPIVFGLYTKEDDHYEVVSYKEIPTVRVTGTYPNGDYNYSYPGVRQLGFYPKKGTGKWFSGTLVVGDGIDLDEGDKQWMIRDKMDFRIKIDMDSLGQLSWKAYHMDFPAASLELQ
jgi:hypothetical protein